MAQSTVSNEGHVPPAERSAPRRLGSGAAAVGLAVLCVSFMLNAMDRQVFYPLLPQIRAEYGFSLDQAGLLATGFTLGLGLTGIPAGYLLDRISRRLVVVISILVYSIGTLAIPFAAGFGDMALYRLISGVGEGVQATAIYAIVGAFYFHRRALAAGFVGAAFGLGIFLGPLFGQAMAAAGGTWRIPFYVFGVAGVVMAAVVRVGAPLAMTEALTGGAARGDDTSYDHVPASPLNRNTIALGVTCVVAGLVLYGFLGLYPTYLREHLGLDAGQVAVAASMFGFGAMAAVPVGWLADRVDQRKLMAVGFVLTSVVGLLTYLVVESAAGQYVLAFLMGVFASAILFTNCSTIMQRAVRPEHVGRGTGLFILFFYVSAAFSGLLFARLVAGLGWTGAGLVQLSLLPLLGIVALMFVERERMITPIPGLRRR